MYIVCFLILTLDKAFCGCDLDHRAFFFYSLKSRRQNCRSCQTVIASQSGKVARGASFTNCQLARYFGQICFKFAFIFFLITNQQLSVAVSDCNQSNLFLSLCTTIANTSKPAVAAEMIHSLFLINHSGDIFLEKHWKSVISRSVCDYFFEAKEKAIEPEDVPPVLQTPHHYLISIFRGKLFFLSVIQTEVPPLFVIEFLHRVADTIQVCKENFREIAGNLL